MLFGYSMSGLNFGEWFLVGFVLWVVLSAPYVGKLGQVVERWLRSA